MTANLENSVRCPASQHFLATVNGVERITWLRLRPRYLGLAGYHTAWRGVRGFGSALATNALLGTMLVWRGVRGPWLRPRYLGLAGYQTDMGQPCHHVDVGLVLWWPPYLRRRDNPL